MICNLDLYMSCICYLIWIFICVDWWNWYIYISFFKLVGCFNWMTEFKGLLSYAYAHFPTKARRLWKCNKLVFWLNNQTSYYGYSINERPPKTSSKGSGKWCLNWQGGIFIMNIRLMKQLGRYWTSISHLFVSCLLGLW